MLNPIDIDHETRETFIGDMVDDFSDGLLNNDLLREDNLTDLEQEFYDALWQISWELEAYYCRYVMGYDAGAQVEP